MHSERTITKETTCYICRKFNDALLRSTVGGWVGWCTARLAYRLECTAQTHYIGNILLRIVTDEPKTPAQPSYADKVARVSLATF